MNLQKDDLTYIMACGDYGVCYQPIVETETLEIFAYEALSRFQFKNAPIPPDAFFKVCHDDEELFFFIESELKKFQIQYHKSDKPIFLNLDPDVTVQRRHRDFWASLFAKHENVVVEIIENSDDENVYTIQGFMKLLDKHGVKYAYDDFGKPNSIFHHALLDRAQFVKLDMFFLKQIRKRPEYFEVLKGVVKYAQLTEQKTILEGIETKDDLQIAKNLGIDYVQGFYFKEHFLEEWKS